MLSSHSLRLARSWALSGLLRAADPTGRLRHELAGSGVAAIALLGVFGRFAVTGAVGQQRDTGAFYFPLTAWLAGELAAGRLPLWCPLIFAGYPIVADGEIGLLYPPNILALALLPVDVAFVLVRTAHYLLAAAGVYALGRVLGVGRTGAVFGGIVFALGGFMIGHLDHGNILRSAAWLPLTLACADCALRSRDRRLWFWLALGAATLTLAGLGLHPQIVLIVLVALGLYVGLRALALASWDLRPGAWISTARSIFALALRGALVVLVISGLGLAGAAIQLGPTYELGEVSSRGGDGLTYAQAAAGGLALVDLLTMLLPYGFRADPAVQWMRYPYWESTVYVGVGGLLLAMIGLIFGPRRVTAPVTALGLLGLLLAMSINAPVDLYGWLWTLPGFSSMRAPVRYGLIFELALALLAAVGVDRLRARVAPRGVRPVALLIAVAFVGLLAAGSQLRGWLLTDEAGALQWLQQTYLELPRDRAALTAKAVRDGLLSTVTLSNPWTLLAALSGAAVALVLALWAVRGRGSSWVAGAAVLIGAAELLVVAHSFHPIIPREELGEASRPMRFLSQQAGYWRTFLTGRSDLSVTSRPALFGVAQAYGYSSLPTTRMERYWTRVNEVDDDLLDLWNVRYVVEPKGGVGRPQAHGVTFDPARPLIDGPAGSPLGDERFRLAPTPADTIRILGSVTRGESIGHGEPVAEITVSAAGVEPVTLVVRAGEHIAEAAYDEGPARMAHGKPGVGVRWEPRDPGGRIYPRDIYVADLPLPSTMQVEWIDVRTVAPQGSLRLAGLGLHERQTDYVRSVLSVHRAKYQVAYDSDTSIIYENTAAQARAFLAPRALAVPEDDWSIVRLVEDARNPRSAVLLERPHVQQVTTVLDGAPLAPDESAEIVRYEPDRVVVRVRTQEPRYLVLSDTYFPGWQATVDGHPAEVERANYLFRAVLTPAGEHVVEWRYLPASLLWGGMVTTVALAAMLMLAMRGLARPAPQRHAVRSRRQAVAQPV